jgi:adenylate cyclase
LGAETVQQLRRSAARRIADHLRRDPERMAKAVELGFVRREWLDHPDEEVITTSTPVDVLERWLESTVEQKPSTLAALGLSAIQILSSNADDVATEGIPDTLTIAFTDLEGFTTYTARKGDEAASHLLAEQQRVVGPIVRSRGGRVVKHLGDGLLVTFTSAEAAVLAGLELVESPPEPLRLRVGLHTGEVLVLRYHDVVGHVVNVGARVAESARGGEVLATEAVKAASGELPGVQFGRLRRRTLKGVDDPVRVCAVARA